MTSLMQKSYFSGIIFIIEYVVWEELGIENDFLFGKVMQDSELCKELLQRILPELQIDRIEYPELQKSIRFFYSFFYILLISH